MVLLLSAYRCVDMKKRIAYHKQMTIIILDTEGLLSLEESGSIFDNQMITMAILTSHIVLINHKGELSSNLEGLIGMSIYAKLHIQSSPMKPKILFVLRDQMDRNKNIFFEQLNKFKDNLHASSTSLKISIDDELEIGHDNISLLSSAFSEDLNPVINIVQRWKNQTFPVQIHDLRSNIFTGLYELITVQEQGYKNFDYLYQKLTNNWKSIDELGENLLECKTLYELSIINELKDITTAIIHSKSQKLLNEGRYLLDNELQKQKQQSQHILLNNTPTYIKANDIYLKQLIENAIAMLDNLTNSIVQEALDDFESRTQQSYYVNVREKIHKNIEPSIRSHQQLLQQRFEEQVYTVAQTNAATHVQHELLNSAAEFFERERQTNKDTNELNEALERKHAELVKEFNQSLNSMKKTHEHIAEIILNIYNRLVKSHNGLHANIWYRCPPLSYHKYMEKCQYLDQVIQAIIIYLQESNEKKTSWWQQLFEQKKNDPWYEYKRRIRWFSDHRDNERNRHLFLAIVQDLIPQLNQDVISMVTTTECSYSDPQTIVALITYVDNALNAQKSCVQQHYRYLNVPQLASDLILISLRILIGEAVRQNEIKHEQLREVINELEKWKLIIKQQFILIKDSLAQGNKFREDLEGHIVSEAIRIYQQTMINVIQVAMSTNTHIEAKKIARNAYDESIGSQPPNAKNILKYVEDINRYYLEIALEKVKLSKDNIIFNEMTKLKTIIDESITTAVTVVRENRYQNVHEIYREIVHQLRMILPGYVSSEMIGILAEIKDPAQFIKSFQQIEHNRQKLQ
ncbi:unnamed protein product, partial [Didymodactylos carnosus]